MVSSPVRESKRRNPRQPIDDDQLDRVFRALGDRTRRALLARLARSPARITELAEPFDMSLAAVSKHLKVLERAELVTRSIDGRVHQCSLQPHTLQEIEKWLDHYREFWTDTLDSLARYVEDDEDDGPRDDARDDAGQGNDHGAD